MRNESLSNEALQAQLGVHPLQWYLDVRAWRWLGELMRMDDGRLARQAAWIFLPSARSRGGQRTNWRVRVRKLMTRVAEALVRVGGESAEAVDAALGGSPRPWNRTWSGSGGLLENWEALARDQELWECHMLAGLALAVGADINVYEEWHNRAEQLKRRARNFDKMDAEAAARRR